MLAVLTLNVSRPPKDRAARLLEYLWAREEEILVLTECGRGQGSALIESVCRAAGFAVSSSLTDADGRPRRGLPSGALGAMVVARGARSLTILATGPGPGILPERVIVTQVEGPVGEPLRLVGVYGAASDPVRYSSATQRRRKREWLLAFCTWVAALPPGPSVLIGDLNIVAPGHRDPLSHVLPEERTAYDLLLSWGWRDAYAETHHGTDLAAEPTWVDHTGVGCRYDHVLVGPGTPLGRAAIDPSPRRGGLTDHSALIWTIGPE